MNINQTAPEIKDGIPRKMPDKRSALTRAFDILLPKEKRHPDDRIIDALKRALPYLEKHLEFISEDHEWIGGELNISETEQKTQVHDLLKQIRAIVREHEEGKRQEAEET